MNSTLKPFLIKVVIAAFITAIAATGVFTAARGIHNAQERAGLDTAAKKNAAAVLKDRLAPEKAQFLFIGDTDHRDTDVIGFVGSEPVMKALAEKGYKNLFLEIRPEFQDLADKVAKGEMTPQQYADAKFAQYLAAGGKPVPRTQRPRFEGIAIKNAAKYGIRSICAERQMKDLLAHTDAVERMTKALVDVFSASHAASVENFGLFHRLRYFLSGDLHRLKIDLQAIITNDPRIATPYQKYRDVMRERLSGDAKLAAYIREKSAGQPSVVFYGAAHGRWPCTLAKQLGATAIEVHGTPVAGFASWEVNSAFGGLVADSLVVSNGAFFTKDDIAKVLVREDATGKAAGSDASSYCKKSR